MDLAGFIAGWSKDKSRKVGAVIVDDRNDLVTMGWNGFPRDIDDTIEDRHKRPIKYKWTEHAERNAIYNAASRGTSTMGCTMYIPWFPCVDCARAIIQSGIDKVVCVEPDWDDKTYGEDFAIVTEMLEEAMVDVVFMENYEAPKQATL
jgi:dCMP deaminase